MSKASCNLVLGLLLLFTAPPALAQQDASKPTPRVLIIGDSVYTQNTQGAAKELKGQASIHYAAWPKSVLASSTNMIEHLDQLLGLKDAAGNEVPEEKRTAWDLIHFNAGLGDLIYCVPNLKSHRTQPYHLGGVVRTDAKQYEKNLGTLVGLLKQKAPEARLVWANTTPIRSSQQNLFRPGDEMAHNQIAQRVMKKYGVPINDMYSYVISIMDMEMPAPRDLDPFYFDKQPLHPPVVDAIVRSLDLTPIKREAE